MESQWVGELRCVGFNFAPGGWELCRGQLLQVAVYEDLFHVIGTTYGGDGMTTFALPDLRGRIPLGFGRGSDGINYDLGQAPGVEVVWLTPGQAPKHSHTVTASPASNTASPAGSYIAPGDSNAPPEFSTTNDRSTMNSEMVTATTPASQGHNNLQPYLVVNWMIALEGLPPLHGDSGKRSERVIEPYVGEVMVVSWDWAPRGWALCNGQRLEIQRYPQLFNLIGRTYGGDSSTFAVPDLRGRVPVGIGLGIKGVSPYNLGDAGGTASVTLTGNHTPAHTHNVMPSAGAAVTELPAGNFYANTNKSNYQSSKSVANVTMNSSMIAEAGGGEIHENIMPSLVLNWIIALDGINSS